VFLLFFNPALKTEVFTAERFAKCMTSDSSPSDWCQAVQHSSRLATVERTDPSRDLALLAVTNMPSGVTGFRAADIEMLQRGDSVAFIGHPGNLLWGSTTGIITAVRTRFPVGDNGLAMVIQAQARVDSEGNSGGPLIGSNGRLAGVVIEPVATRGLPAVPMRTVPAELNAIPVDEVLRFLRSGHR
jgi:S1-C subfamily serine protease